MSDLRGEVVDVIRATLTDLEVTWRESGPGLFSVTLPGTHKLSTECALEVGEYAVGIRAFVARRPDENQRGVYEWLLQRNLRTYGVAFCLDALGDIYLSGKLGLASVTGPEIDRWLGSVAEVADDSFNVILELGFAESIRREWAWRRSRGESTANLAAFRHLDSSTGEDGRTG